MSEPLPVWSQAENLAYKLAKLDMLLSTFIRCQVVEEFEEKEVVTLLSLASDLALESRNEAESIMTAAQAQFGVMKKAGLI